MPTWMQYAIVCPLIFLGGFVDAIAGGGGLITLPAYLIAGFPVHVSIGTNKLSSTIGTTITTWKFWKRGYIRPKLSLICALCALVGSAIGANIGMHLSDRVFKPLLLVILPLTALYVFRTKTIGASEKDALPPPGPPSSAPPSPWAWAPTTASTVPAPARSCFCCSPARPT